MPRVVHLVSHPIQYFVPIYRILEKSGEIDLHVCYGSAFGLKPSLDHGIGKEVTYGNNLLVGYKSSFLSNTGSGVPNGNSRSFDCPRIAKELVALKPDILWIHGWGYRMHHQAMRWARRNGIPYVLRGETTLLDAPKGSLRWWRRRMLYSRFFRGAARMLYIGEQNRRFLRSMGVPDRKLVPMHYSIDTDAFQPTSTTSMRRQDRFVVVTLSKLIARKRVDDIIHAVSKLPDSIELHVLGDGEERAKLEQLAKPHEHRMHFHGFVEQSRIPEYFSWANLFVLASSEETWGLVVNEAMACGVPCVVSDRCGCALDLVGPQSVFPCGNVQTLSAMIRSHFENRDRHYAGTMRDKIVHGYSSHASARQFLGAISSL